MLNYELLTEYASALLKDTPLSEYPRPQLVRDSYLNLNGQWDFQADEGEKRRITVPFPPESCLSGIGCPDIAHKKNSRLVYRRRFIVDSAFLRDITMLHIGAADQSCAVTLNGQYVGEHFGGYLSADFDISKFVTAGENTLQIEVKDELSYLYPTGKQRKKRGGIWYTPISGIWQTVWLESMSRDYVQGLNFTPDIDRRSVKIDINSHAPCFEITVSYSGKTLLHRQSKEKSLEVDFDEADLHLWSPEDPALYDIKVKTAGDEVHSYFAMRKFVSENGCFRLNNKPYFVNGLLDQGYFSDGIYTPASYKAYRDDILSMKALGFNTLRKHIKVEPMLFYHYCDTLGMLVFQDMVNVGKYSFFKDTVLPFAFNCQGLRPYVNVNKAQQGAFVAHSSQIVDYLAACPCVVGYTIFNEGWGQFDGDGMYKRLKAQDGSRVYDATSGWFRENLSDMYSSHIYFKPISAPKKADKTWIVSEFGGYSCACQGHVFNSAKAFGYKKFDDIGAFEEKFVQLYKNEIIGNIPNGLAGAIYTQVSDVEDEINGLLSYDRKVCKLDTERIKNLNQQLYETFEAYMESKG